MRSLADESSVSVPTVYALVGGRDDVITALMDAGVERFDMGVAALSVRGLFRATAIVELFADIVDHERGLVHELLASGALMSAGREPLLLFHRVRTELKQAFVEALKDGELQPGNDPEFAATSMVRLGMGAFVDWVIGQGDPPTLRAELLRSLSLVIGACS